MLAHETRKCTDALAKVAEEIQSKQRDMSRDVIEPTVQAAMTDAYADCCAESGSGQFARMRVLMHKAVEHNKSHMFTEAAGLLRHPLISLVMHACLQSFILFYRSFCRSCIHSFAHSLIHYILASKAHRPS